MTVEEFIQSQPKGTQFFERQYTGRFVRHTPDRFAFYLGCITLDAEFLGYEDGGECGIRFAVGAGREEFFKACAIRPKAAPVARPARETLPRVVEVLGVDGTGLASCPHCGAAGRYIYEFRCDDGTTRRAMAGCFARFPMAASVARRANDMRRFA